MQHRVLVLCLPRLLSSEMQDWIHLHLQVLQAAALQSPALPVVISLLLRIPCPRLLLVFLRMNTLLSVYLHLLPVDLYLHPHSN